MNLRDHRNADSDVEWELPKWGHPISKGVMPLLIGVRGRLFPVGTIFATGTDITFMVTATHNIQEVLKQDRRFSAMIAEGKLEGSHTLSLGYELYALHHEMEGENIQFSLWPLETIDGVSKTDVVFAHPQFTTEIRRLVFPLSFDFPAKGDVVLSVGYSEFTYPEDGIDLEAVKSGCFDWLGSYSHKLFVVESAAEYTFKEKFASGFLEGPCFAFSQEIRHAMSGGPIFNSSGNVCAVNSAAASTFFDRPMSLGSMLSPILHLRLRFGAVFGPITVNGRRSLIDLITHGAVSADGSERNEESDLDRQNEDRRSETLSGHDDQDFVFNDFKAFQESCGNLSGPVG